MAERNILQKILQIQPGIALGQWGYERIVNNWSLLTALFVGGGGMSYLASISEIIAPFGPVGIGGIGLISALLVWVGLAWARGLRANARERLANARAVEKWKEQTDTVNPLDPEFQRARINIADLAHPVTRRISNKRFIDCQLMGPSNLIIMGKTSLANMDFTNCDLVVVNNKKTIPIYNALLIEECQMIGGEIVSCTIYIPPEMVNLFRGFGADFLSFTGDPQIDTPQPQDTEQKTQP